MSSSISTIAEVLTHYRELQRFLSNKLGNRFDAEDIAQSSYEQLLSSLQGRRGASIESPRALLFRIARNLCVDHYRSQQTARDWAAGHAAAQGLQAAPASDYIAAQRQIIERVVAQLMRLPRARREVFILFRAYGMSRTEIATRLGIQESTVAKHVVRATLDCAHIFAELQASLPEHVEPANGYRDADDGPGGQDSR
ncbi:RNA polymerase sigma factor [Thauera linaloolentis]|uniref:RNA polymerase sigma factor n=1 Tax=Thauera linaloolentis TaxID=76112 RepID=UPI001B7FBA66|nr:sigma-70 family RNA polymerase sigma factor [Thauera linaloolentis]MCM8564934.1 sigma-70 family RNA polymerase sigma factor [Thauera linaloolentis]